MADKKETPREKFEAEEKAKADKAIPERKPEAIPQKEPATIPADMSKLSPLQQEISGYVSTAKKEPPRITDVRDLFTRIAMEIPKGVSRGPEYDYCWLSIEELSSISGTKWEIVNRNNHSHAPQRMFDRAGAILYKGQNILAFCYKEARELEQAAIVADFNAKTSKMTKKQDSASDSEVRNIPITAAGNIVTSGTVDSFAGTFPPEKDDY